MNRRKRRAHSTTRRRSGKGGGRWEQGRARKKEGRGNRLVYKIKNVFKKK